MPIPALIFIDCVTLALSVIDLAILVRVVYGLILAMRGKFGEDDRFMLFLLAITEPAILPMRMLCSRIRALESFPLDVPLLLTPLFLSFVINLLSTLP